MFRTLLSIVLLSAFTLALPSIGGAAQAPAAGVAKVKGEALPTVNITTASVPKPPRSSSNTARRMGRSRKSKS